ncbi:MAG: hypothetical protein BZY88_20030 [SAR202 cluster bacterium Io17-Chloro-G9]|nr:MAG: hypothetical protein BZY88_20030 [SAR202 cluster bacterium Io17-Chloro-G9]
MRQFGHDADNRLSLKRRVFSVPTLVSLALAVAFLVFLVTKLDLDIGATWSKIRETNPWYVVAAMVVHYATFPFRGARWQRLLRNTNQPDDPVPGVAYCSQLVLLGWFANSVGWFRLGDAYRAYLYREENAASFSRTIGTLLAERMLDAALVVFLLALALPFLVGGGGFSWAVLATAAGLAAVLVLVLAALVWAGNWVNRFLPPWLALRYQRFQQGTLGSFQKVPLLSVLGLLAWLAEIARLYLVVQALGLDLSFPLVTFIALASSLLTLVPTPGGFGAVEPGIAGLLVRLTALSSTTAAALVVVDRSISYLSVILAGAALFLGRQWFRRVPTAMGPSPSP